MTADLTDVLVGAPDLSGDADLAEVRPGSVGELDCPTRVRTAQSLTVRTVGADCEPERVGTSTVIDIGCDFRTTSLAIRNDAVKTVGEEVRAVGTKDDDRRELSAVRQR